MLTNDQKVQALKAFATANTITIGRATSVDGIEEKLIEAKITTEQIDKIYADFNPSTPPVSGVTTWADAVDKAWSNDEKKVQTLPCTEEEALELYNAGYFLGAKGDKAEFTLVALKESTQNTSGTWATRCNWKFGNKESIITVTSDNPMSLTAVYYNSGTYVAPSKGKPFTHEGVEGFLFVRADKNKQPVKVFVPKGHVGLCANLAPNPRLESVQRLQIEHLKQQLAKSSALDSMLAGI